jgi:hypothetical protein
MKSRRTVTDTKSVEGSVPAPPPSPSRCTHTSRTGKPCRYFASPASRFCKHHARDDRADTYDALAVELAEAAGDFSAPDAVMKVMSKVFHALVQRRITAKDAGVLCYISQTILQSQRAMAYLQKLNKESAEESNEEELQELRRRAWPKISVNVPRSDRDPKPPQDLVTPAVEAAVSPEGRTAKEPQATAPVVAALSSSTPATSPTSSVAPPPKLPPPVVAEPPPKPPDLNHFYHRDLTLPPSVQDPRSYTPPPPDQAELDRRNRRFDRVHGYRRNGNQGGRW